MTESNAKSSTTLLGDETMTCEGDINSAKSRTTIVKFATLLVVGIAILIVANGSRRHTDFSSLLDISTHPKPDKSAVSSARVCYNTCRFTVVESVPQNISITKFPIPSTFDAWQWLISSAVESIDVAAYKSSLRGRHVFGSRNQDYSTLGERIYDELEFAGLERNVNIRVVENSPSKDRGDNADARSLAFKGAIERRTLNMKRLSRVGIMHSKFLIADRKSFYLGSANLDWRSLNHKLEMGVLVRNCPCLAKELEAVFDTYWHAAHAANAVELEQHIAHTAPLTFNRASPLRIQYDGIPTDIFIATSPRIEEAPQHSWDLEAIVSELNAAQHIAYIHVMDIFPVFIYQNPQTYWPDIDNAIREAVLRGVEVKIIAAALHFPKIGLSFFKSLQLLNEVEVSQRGSIQVRIYSVPTPADMPILLRRERRTHKKLLVTDEAVIIGTSNWSGDYFTSLATGVAIVARQNASGEQPLIAKMRGVFMRDWNSPYAHKLDDYYNACHLDDSLPDADFCEIEKDDSFKPTTH